MAIFKDYTCTPEQSVELEIFMVNQAGIRIGGGDIAGAVILGHRNLNFDSKEKAYDISGQFSVPEFIDFAKAIVKFENDNNELVQMSDKLIELASDFREYLASSGHNSFDEYIKTWVPDEDYSFCFSERYVLEVNGEEVRV